jgi:hypothetical protein
LKSRLTGEVTIFYQIREIVVALGVSPRGSKAQEQPMTGQSLHYLAEGNLQPKILAIAEEQGARKGDAESRAGPRYADLLSGLHSGWRI